jgi:hypothetical protein
MIAEIDVDGRIIPFRLDPTNRRWHSLVQQHESDFPLVTVQGGKRYELYSDGTYAEVEK